MFLHIVLEPGLLGAPVRRDLSSERDFDMKRGLLATKPGIDLRTQNFGEPPILSRLPVQIPASGLQVQGSSLVDDESSKGYQNNKSDTSKADKHWSHQNPLGNNSQGCSSTSLCFTCLFVKNVTIFSLYLFIFVVLPDWSFDRSCYISKSCIWQQQRISN